MPDYFDTERTSSAVERHVEETTSQVSSAVQKFSSLQQQEDQPSDPATTGRSLRQLPSLDEQRAEIIRARVAERDRQVEQWREQSMHLLDPTVRFRALLEECARQELLRTSALPSTRVSQRPLVDETRLAYTRLLKEAKFLFEERRRLGASEAELHQVCAQAISSFASLYPWGSGIRCDDLDECHPYYAQLCARGVISRGESSVTLMTSFTGALACAQAKIQAALRRKQSRLFELSDKLLQDEVVKIVDHLGSPVNTTATSSSIPTVSGSHRKSLSSIDAP